MFWVRFRDADGKLRREKAGRKGDAIDLFRKRTEERRVGLKLPENLRAVGVRFGALCDDILVFSAGSPQGSKEHHWACGENQTGL